MRPSGIGSDRASSSPLRASRRKITSAGGPPAPLTASPVRSVRPSGANATSAVMMVDDAVWLESGSRVAASTRSRLAVLPFEPPIASVRPSGLKARAWIGLTTAPIMLIWLLPGDRAADSLQRARVEEDDAAVISADRKRAAVRGQRVVEGPVTTPVHDRERSRAANERGKQVAARGR